MDKVMTEELGSEIAEFIRTYRGKKIQCFGTCHKPRVMDKFVGYPHSGGLKSKDAPNGEEEGCWWVYFECPKCKYGHSFSKIPRMVEQYERDK